MALNLDLQAIRNNHNTQLAKAHKDANTQLTAFKSNLCTEHEQCKSNLKHNRLFSKVAKCKNTCLTPICMPTVHQLCTTSQSSSRAPSPASSNCNSESLTTEVIFPKNLITVPLNVEMDVQEGNSPTPCTDIPLIPQPDPTPKNAILKALAQGLKQLNENFTGKLNILASHLDCIESAEPSSSAWDKHFGYGSNDTSHIYSYSNKNMLEQDTLLTAQHHQALQDDPISQAALNHHNQLNNNIINDDIDMKECTNFCT